MTNPRSSSNRKVIRPLPPVGPVEPVEPAGHSSNGFGAAPEPGSQREPRSVAVAVVAPNEAFVEPVSGDGDMFPVCGPACPSRGCRSETCRSGSSCRYEYRRRARVTRGCHPPGRLIRMEWGWQGPRDGRAFRASERPSCGAFRRVAGCFLEPDADRLGGVAVTIPVDVVDMPPGRAGVFDAVPLRGSSVAHRAQGRGTTGGHRASLRQVIKSSCNPDFASAV